jgi:hypothetical protein
LKDYLKVVTTELKSAQQVIGILYEDEINANNLKNQDNLIEPDSFIRMLT